MSPPPSLPAALDPPPLPQQQIFQPLDYESLQQELALKESVWRRVSPNREAECTHSTTTTVVFRMDQTPSCATAAATTTTTTTPGTTGATQVPARETRSAL